MIQKKRNICIERKDEFSSVFEPKISPRASTPGTVSSLPFVRKSLNPVVLNSARNHEFAWCFDGDDSI